MLLRTYPLITHPAFLRYIENAGTGDKLFPDLPGSEVPTHCPRLKTPYDLSEFLGVSPLLVRSFVATKEKHYRSFQIKKRSGGVRTIDAPRTFLKVAQWWILDTVLSCREDPPYVYGFSRGRSFVDNARAHIGSSHVLNVDVENFFPSIDRLLVARIFESMGYSASVANFFTEVCTLEGRLPQGAPTSPRISNFVMHEVDLWLNTMASELGCTYTRYADDLTFSSKERIPSYVVDELGQTLGRVGLRLNPKKTRFMGSNQRKEVTGLVLTATGIGLSKEYLNGTRGWFHSISETPDFFSGEIQRVAGTLNLLKQVGGRGTPRLLDAGELALASLRAVAPPKISW